jgi:hypothetical protein
MPAAAFDTYRKDTNLIDRAHHYSNQGGIGTSLGIGLIAITK